MKRFATHLLSFVLLLQTFFAPSLWAHGLAGETMVYILDRGAVPLGVACLGGPNWQRIKSRNFEERRTTWRKIKGVGRGMINCYTVLSFDDNRANDIICSPEQEFMVTDGCGWMEAFLLVPGDKLFCDNGLEATVKETRLVEEPLQVCILQVKDTRNYYVGALHVLTHNTTVPWTLWISITLAFGEGAASGATIGTPFGPVGIMAGAAVGATMCWILEQWANEQRVHGCGRCVDVDALQKRWDQLYLTKAPGKPTEADGFFPPKNWDGRKERCPNTGGYGWRDERDRIWIPTGEGHNTAGHGSAHWDRQYPNKGGYDNVYPGGKVRPGTHKP